MPPEGQLLPAERERLHDEILNATPNVVFEVGTWYGGGSTLQITSALQKIKNGTLITCEPSVEHFNVASSYYKGRGLSDFCQVLNMPSSEAIEWLLREFGPPDFIFFDGGEDPEVALNDFKRLDECVQSGTIFMMHDWLHDISQKQIKIKPYLEQLDTWFIDYVMKPPASVGLVKAFKL